MSSATTEAGMKAAEVLLEELMKLQPGSPSPSLPGSLVSSPTILGEDTEPEPEAAEPEPEEQMLKAISTTNKSNFYEYTTAHTQTFFQNMLPGIKVLT